MIADLTRHPAKELLIIFGDDRKSPPAVIDKYRRLRAMGVRMRQLVEAGNEFLHGPIDEYRAVPADHFQNWVSLVYGDKLATSIDGNRGGTIIHDADTARVERLKFDLLWSVLPKPERSVADVRF